MSQFHRVVRVLSSIFLLVSIWLAIAPPSTVLTASSVAQTPTVPSGGVTAVAYSRDGKVLASASADSQIYLWDTATGKLRQTLPGHLGAATAVAFSPDGKLLASAGRDSVIRLWDVTSGKELRAYRGHAEAVRAVAFSPDGKTLASGGEDTRVLVWDVGTGRLNASLSGHANFVSAVAFSPDGTALASGSSDTRIILWDVAKGQQRQTLRGHAGEVTAVAFSPNGRTLASGSSDATLRLWDVVAGQQNQLLRGLTTGVRSVAFSPDGMTLASGGDDNQVTLWNAANGRQLRVFKGHTDIVTGIAFSPDGKVLADGSQDSTIILWNVTTGQEIRALKAPTNTGKKSATPPGRKPTPSSTGQTTSGPSATAALAVDQGPGGPILVITSATNPFSKYYAEILRNEGFNEFAVVDIASVSSTTLASADVVILGETSLTAAQVTMLGDWITAGGHLVAMRPDKQLSGLLGLADAASTLSNGYLLVDTSVPPGNGIVNQTIQYHGTADRYTLNGASTIARLYANASTATSNPAVTIRGVGTNGGQAAAFTYDLARSIVYARQGDPAWAGQERDGITPIRSDDQYYGDASFDPQADWVDLNKVVIPQADEQQRLLANLILSMNQSKKPLPRFWYLPFGKKAVVVMTGDDHGNGGTVGRFDTFIADSPAGCSVANWECVRATSYVYPSTPLSDQQAAYYASLGFEVGLHVDTNCSDWASLSDLDSFYSSQLSEWSARFPSLSSPATNRTHCVPWSDWASQPKVENSHGMRLDTTYYYWPPNWVNDRPGFFTGSGMPMRLTDLDGTMIDVYQATTQLTDESGQDFPFTVDTLLDNALGPTGYYGAFTVNAHTDTATSSVADAVITSAQSRGVPIVSSLQMLTWLDGRNSSSFGSLTWNGTALSFTITPGNGATGLQAMVPTHAASMKLTGITRDGSPVAYTTQGIKGVEYAFLSASSGSYVATYGADTTPPTVIATSPAHGATDINAGTTATATFSEDIDPATINASTFTLRDSSNAAVLAAVGYDAATRTATLTPNATLAYATAYTATVTGGSSGVKDLAGNAMASNYAWSFTTSAASNCPCSIWSSSATPSAPSISDPNAVELGVKFQADVDGYITGIRYYKSGQNTGTHIGNLWTSAGQRLATATFTNETASGWQQVGFPAPVKITAKTTYVASYHTNVGYYAGDSSYFAASGVDNAPLHALRDGVSGGNGVYIYGASAFPSFAYQASNYWVDVVFTTTVAADTTPPSVTTTAPASGAADVSAGTSVAATFSEAIDQTTISTTTFTLRGPSNAGVTATISYNSATNTATLTPNATLANATVYTATVTGGSSGVKDVAGNAMASSYIWSFTTAAAPACPCSIWSSSATPATPSDSDATAIELGVKFQADVDGYITGIRYYKSGQNTGTHIGNLWTSAGQRLATATFTGESASGWQQVSFATPVKITAKTTYVASYHTDTGHYAGDSGYFASSDVYNAPLRALRDGVSGGNGVYIYGASAFPSFAYQATNYWVDVVFTTTVAADTTPPTVTTTAPASGAADVSAGTSVAATFSEAIDQTTISTTTFTLRGPSNAGVTATISYNSATNTATLTPNATLANATVYTATVTGGSSGVKDVAGNAMASSYIWSFTTSTSNASGACAAPANPIVAENCLVGNPASEWDISGAGDPSIQGYATDISVNRGDSISFKIDTNASSYRLDIYRLGYYGGMGARKVATIQPSAFLPQAQPNCLNDTTTGLIDCGNWAVSASWAVPPNAASGIYIAKVVRTDTGGASHIVFVVRDDASTSELLFQTSDTTWQAYNNYGGNSLYTGSPGTNPSRAYKVSYNRPFNTRAVDGGQDWLFNAEYPMVRWLEANGYNVSYFTGVDSDRRGALIRNHKVYLSVGHDEYWSGGQRTNVEAARNARVHLAFFSGNEIFWKTRWENSIDGLSTPYRTLVSYKETHANAVIDPQDPPTWTGTWRDPRFSPPADGGRPENALAGTIFMVNDGATVAIQVPADDGKMRFWRNTSIATLAPGSTATLADSTLGYEWDEELDNGFRPAGLFRMSTTTVNNAPVLEDYGSTYGTGMAIHHLTLYRHTSGALVFGAGTVQWSWGLDGNHDRGSGAPDVRMQQATVNLLADMGTQPATLQPGLAAAMASTDATAPTSTITAPISGATLQINSPITINGTANDAGGGAVGGVEVSVDGGTTWHPAVGRTSWSYTWTPAVSGTVTIKSRAVDDSGNLENPSAGTSVTVADTTTSPPTVTSTSPASGATGVSTGTSVIATFSRAMDQTTINTTTFTLRGPSNAGVTATLGYNSATNTATLTPSSPLAAQTAYTTTVIGGSSGVKDLAGNAMASSYTWSFTTAAAPTCPCSIWSSSATPATSADPDTSAVELGVKFQSNIDGYITGVRFYKSSQNTGTHIGNLWTSSGQLLATATFTNETASGWQQVSFATPVKITANTTYVASYHTNVGRYADDAGYFTNFGVYNAPLQALRDGVSGANGVYAYGASAFPTSAYQASNYWVDVVFVTTP